MKLVKGKGNDIMAKENVRNLVGVIIFYLVIVFGVIALTATPEDPESSNNTISLKNQ